MINMKVEAIYIRIKNIHTGEFVDTDEFCYCGSEYDFFVSLLNDSEWTEITPELKEKIMFQGLKALRINGFERFDFTEGYGLIGVLKHIALGDFYQRFGYATEILMERK